MARSKRSSPKAAKASRPDLPTYLAARRRRRQRIALVAVTLLAAAVLIDRSGLLLHQGDDRSRYDGQRYEVVQVLTGDTLELAVADGGRATTLVRLWGIRTPLPAQPERGRRTAEPFADEAIAFVQHRALGRRVRLTVEGHRLRDEAGHLLAHVHHDDGLSLNAQLLRAGLASVDTQWSHERMDDYAKHEARARALGRGVWADGAR